MELTQKQLRAVQLRQLEIMVEIDHICRREGLSYYLAAGTLLGAVRHQGFIPWDDDLDISMPRDDYNRFMKHGQQWLSDSFFLQNYNTDKECYSMFAKVRMNGTVFKEQAVAHLDCHHGIFVDVFPLDAVSANRKARKRNSFLIEQVHRIIFQKLNIRGGYGNLVFYFIRELIGRIFSIRNLGSLADWLARRYQYAETGMITVPLSPLGGEIALMTEDQYHKPAEILFEGIMFFCPSNPEIVLRVQFGDFMRLPPEEQRVGCHNIAEIKF